jgi:D-apionolactonase
MDPSSVGHRNEALVQQGDFSYWVDRAQVATLSWCGREVIRRLFVTVRDEHWRETPPTEWEAKPLKDGLGQTLKAVHHSLSMAFEWEGTLKLERNTLSFKIDGRALRDMNVCRVGLIVLYPVRSLLGSFVEVEGPGGINRLQIHEALYPQPIIDGLPCGITPPFSSLSMKFPDGDSLQCRFIGELFELEDQRNWGDASFKAYCPPLGLGFPRRVKRGTVFRHAVKAALTVRTARSSSDFELGLIKDPAQPSLRFPNLGISAAAKAYEPLGLSDLNWSHIRVDVPNPEAHPSVMRTIEQLPATSGIELCVTVDENGSINHVVAEILRKAQSCIVRLLLRGAGSHLPTAKSISGFRETLKASNILPPSLLVTTDGYFVELNRDGPLPMVDGVAFPFSSTVHLRDQRTLAESPAVLSDIVSSARKLSGQSTVAISPLALFHPPSTAANAFPQPTLVPWVLAMLIASAQSHVSSLTLATDTVNALSTGQSQHVLERLQRWSHNVVLPLISHKSEDVYAACVKSDEAPEELILVNFRRNPVHVYWSENQFRIKRMVNASTGAPTDLRRSSIHLASATAIIAALT